MVITSRQHPLCKLVRSLGNARERRVRGLFVAPGGNAVTAALAARWPLERIVATPEDAEDVITIKNLSSCPEGTQRKGAKRKQSLCAFASLRETNFYASVKAPLAISAILENAAAS